MDYAAHHPTFVFLLFTFPLMGWTIYKSLSKKTISTTLYISLALLLPFFTGYSYIIDNAYGYLFYLVLTFAYALLHEVAKPNIWPTIILSAGLFFVCGLYAFLGAMGGTVTVDGEWRVKGYRIEHVREQGFAGRPLTTYELSKYGVIPLFIRHVGSRLDYDTANSCWVRFEKAGFTFNKCHPDSSHTIP